MNGEEFHSEVTMEYYRSNVAVVREIGLLAIKTLITLNSGAFIVLLTFIGNTAASAQFTIPLESLKFALFCFLAGLAAIFLAITATYITAQNSSPYPTGNEVSQKAFLFLMICFPALSFLAFLAGVYTVIANVGHP